MPAWPPPHHTPIRLPSHNPHVWARRASHSHSLIPPNVLQQLRERGSDIADVYDLDPVPPYMGYTTQREHIKQIRGVAIRYHHDWLNFGQITAETRTTYHALVDRSFDNVLGNEDGMPLWQEVPASPPRYEDVVRKPWPAAGQSRLTRLRPVAVTQYTDNRRHGLIFDEKALGRVFQSMRTNFSSSSSEDEEDEELDHTLEPSSPQPPQSSPASPPRLALPEPNLESQNGQNLQPPPGRFTPALPHSDHQDVELFPEPVLLRRRPPRPFQRSYAFNHEMPSPETIHPQPPTPLTHGELQSMASTARRIPPPPPSYSGWNERYTVYTDLP